MTDVADHYATGSPLELVRAGLEKLAPGGGPVTLDQLGGFDDFHTAGRGATVRMADLLSPGADDTVLDAGCGLGGPARYLADRFDCRVVGIDLTPVFVEIGQLLNERTGLGDRVELRVGDITAMDLDEGSVDHAWTQHVAMNIADRPALYAEIRRVMKPGGRFGLFDVIDAGGGELLLPVPWATKAEHSHLETRDSMRTLLEGAGFRIEQWDDPTAEMLAVMRAMMGPPPAGVEPPALSTAMLIDDVQTKAPTYFRNMEEGRTGLLLAVCTAV